MRDNEAIIRELYELAEGANVDMKTFVSSFSDYGYLTNTPTGVTIRGESIGRYIGALSTAFPDLHRELSSLYVMGDVVVVELVIRGMHRGSCPFPREHSPRQGGRSMCRAVMFSISQNEKITSFHCYNAASVLQQQLGVVQ